MEQGWVPKFGNWEASSTVPYTEYFEKARRGRRRTNPNEPNQNPEAHADEAQPVHTPPVGAERSLGGPELRDVRLTRREGGDFRPTIEPSVLNEAMKRKPLTDPPHQRHGDRGSYNDLHRRPDRINAGVQSPLHPNYQAKSGSKFGTHASSLERKVLSEVKGPAPITQGRSSKNPRGQGYESPEKDLAVPRFGEWDEHNPSSGDNYTGIFNKLRENRASPGADNVPSYPNGRQRNSGSKNKKCSCLSWLAKRE